jgi:hypothetical protein
MASQLPLFGWVLCLLPISCATSGSPGNEWSGTPAPMGTASAGNPASANSSSGTSSGGTGVVTGVSSSNGGESPQSGSSGGSRGSASGSSSGGSSGSSGAASSSGTPLGSVGDAGTTTQSKDVPDIFADAGMYSPPAEAGSGEHHAGESCSQSNCHGPAGQETPFLIAGTVFKDYAGTIPYVGVEVRVQDANGKIMTTYSRQNGNFYIGGGALALPAIVAARDGTTTRPMVTQLTTAQMGSCASAGCHVVGGSPSTGAYYPIHVP